MIHCSAGFVLLHSQKQQQSRSIQCTSPLLHIPSRYSNGHSKSRHFAHQQNNINFLSNHHLYITAQPSECVEVPLVMKDTNIVSKSSEPIPVSEELISIYEKSSGFDGIGKIMLRAGFWVLVDIDRSRV